MSSRKIPYDKFLLLSYEEQCELDICQHCIHCDVCDVSMRPECDSFIKGDPKDYVLFTNDEYEEHIKNLKEEIKKLNNIVKDQEEYINKKVIQNEKTN